MSEKKKPEFTELINQIKAGSEEAVGMLIEHYAAALQKVIRGRLNQRMRSQYDTEDFSQLVWASFFTNLDKITSCRSERALAGLLMTMARNKVVDAWRRREVNQRNKAEREQPIDTDDSFTAISLRSSDATPSHIVSMREQWDRLLKTLPQRHRKMIILRAQGCTYREIADQVEMNERTIRRVFESILSNSPTIRGTGV